MYIQQLRRRLRRYDYNIQPKREARMTRRKKTALIVAGSIAALLLFTAFILPLIVRSQAVTAIEAETGRKARIDRVAINPLTLTVTVTGVSLEAKGGGAFISIGRLRTSLGLASIYRRALILTELAIDSPAITFARLGAHNYDFNDIIERQKAKPAKKSTGEFHFLFNNITLTNGSLDFNDQAVSGGRKHVIQGLNITLPFIGNIPSMVETFTAPRISATVDGTPFSFEGKLKPFSTSLETSVHVGINQLSLPKYVAYSPVRPPVDLTSGTLTLDTDVTYRVSRDRKPELAIEGVITLDGVAVNLRGGQPLVRLPRLTVKANELDVFARSFLFDNITVDGLELFVSRDAKGAWMYDRLLSRASQTPEKPSPAAATEKDKKRSPLLMEAATMKIKNGAVHFTDAVPSGSFKTGIGNIEATVTDFSTAADKKVEYVLSMLVDTKATFRADGSFSLAPLKGTMAAELNGLKIERGWPYLSRYLTAPLAGTLDLSSHVTYDRESGLAVEKGKLLVSGLAARYGGKEGLALSRLEISNAGFSQKTNVVDIGEVRLAKGNISLSREADGAISILSLLRKQQAAAPAAKHPPAAAPQGGMAAPELSLRLGKCVVERFNTSFTDRMLPDKPRFTLTNTSLSLSDLTWPRFKPSPLKFSSTFNKATPLKATGVITPQPFRYKGKVSVGRLPIRDFEAYFPANVNVFILGGYADTAMNVDISLAGGKPTGSFKGNASLRGFHAVDTIAEEDLLKWESLQLDDIQGTLEPFSLALRQVALNGVYSKIIIRKDGTLNVQNLVAQPEQAASGTGGKPAGAAPSAGGTAVTPPQPAAPVSAPPHKKSIAIGTVTVQDGTLSFVDDHLPQHFATTFYNLGGRISGLNSDEAKFADVDLRGNLENHSPLQITGQINPLRDDLFVNLKISFRDIELSPVSPYSGAYLGYTVEKGKLFLDLTYHIDKKQLNSENKVFIDQFTFGKKVESDTATNLPVKLGLAMLKDRKGEIHLDLPVTGRTDDPKFSIVGVVWQVIKNVLVKAVSSPFSLLSSMFGGGQDLSVIQFSPGVSTIPSGEEQKLNALATALLDRPALKVELKGYVDRERDSEGYRNELLDRKMKSEKVRALSKAGLADGGAKNGEVRILPEEYDTYLTAVYKREKFPKPRNILGFTKELPPAEMKKLIIANTVIGTAELTTLAQERVVAVKDYLIEKGKVPAERVFQKNDTIFKAPEKESISRSRVELNAIAQ